LLFDLHEKTDQSGTKLNPRRSLAEFLAIVAAPGLQSEH